MVKFEVVFTVNADSHRITTLFTYAASRRAAVAWADDWARRCGWHVDSVRPVNFHKPASLSSAAP